MNDQLAKSLRLVAASIILFAVAYFLSNFRLYTFHDWKRGSAGGSVVRTNNITGSSDVIVLRPVTYDPDFDAIERDAKPH